MTAPDTEIAGLHLMGNLRRCAAGPALLADAALLRERCIGLAKEAGLTVVGDCFHQFTAPGGVTGVVVLAESHLCVHTWPENGYVTLDVFVCNVNCDNRSKAKHLFDAVAEMFQPGEKRLYSMERD